MSTAVAQAQLGELAAQWRGARLLYPIYAAVVRQYRLGIEPSRDLEYPVDRSEPEAIARIQKWFVEADDKIEVWQLRQVLQTSDSGSEAALGAFVVHLLEKEQRTEADRDKVDFLLAQYFFHCAPAKMHQAEPTLDEVAEVLEPVLGESIPESPAWLTPLDLVVADLRQCESLRDLLERGVLARARKLKTDAGDMFFGSGAMLTFTRFNFIVRGVFVRLIHNDLHAIRFALHGLEQRGQKGFDCSAAGLGTTETPESLRLFCHEWKTMFRAAYSSGQPFQQLIQLRNLLETALAAPLPLIVNEPVSVPAPPPAEAPSVAPPPEIADPEAPPVAAATPIEEPAAQPRPQPAAPTAASVQKEIAAAYKAQPKPAVQKPAAKHVVIGGKPAATPASDPTDVEGCLERIAEQLLKQSAKTGTAVTAVVVAGHKLMLSSWEVAAYVEGGDDVSDALQRAVAARALLSRVAEDRKQGKEVEVVPALAAAHAEAAALQAHIAQAKEKKNIDGAVNLAASARRLIGLMEELESGPKPPQRSAQ